MKKRPRRLECLSLTVPDEALETYEAALECTCETVAFFRDHAAGTWRLEGVREVGHNENDLITALVLAAAVTGVTAATTRVPTDADGWVERTRTAFPEQFIGRRFAIRGSHLAGAARSARTTLILDAGVAFGSGEHNSTRGCLVALEQLIPRIRHAGRSPFRIVDMGTGSGILAMAAAKTLRRMVLATDIEPWSVRVARDNARRNGLRNLLRPVLADGWRCATVRRSGPFDLVFANILARPLRLMARDLARNLAPGGVAILSGLLRIQARDVVTAHRRAGLILERMIHLGPWTTIVIRKAA